MSKALIYFALLITLFSTSSCQSDKDNPRNLGNHGQYQTFETIAFDTTVTVHIRPQKGLDYGALFQQISDRILEIEKIASLYLDDSEVTLLNQQGSLEASDEFISLLKKAIHAGEQTQGLFDISIQPLWDFYHGSSSLSSVEGALELVDYKSIHINGQLVQLNPGMKLSFNGMIQGYLTDAIFHLLQESPVKNALINGGEYRALGTDGEHPWQITITGKGGQEISQLNLADSQALAVTAGYGYIFSYNNKARTHLFHPKNQQTISKKKTYVVRASNATQADIYATLAAITDQADKSLNWKKIAPAHAQLSVFE